MCWIFWNSAIQYIIIIIFYEYTYYYLFVHLCATYWICCSCWNSTYCYYLFTLIFDQSYSFIQKDNKDTPGRDQGRKPAVPRLNLFRTICVCMICVAGVVWGGATRFNVWVRVSRELERWVPNCRLQWQIESEWTSGILARLRIDCRYAYLLLSSCFSSLEIV